MLLYYVNEEKYMLKCLKNNVTMTKKNDNGPKRSFIFLYIYFLF